MITKNLLLFALVMLVITNAMGQQKATVKIQSGHSEMIDELVYSNNGKYIASGSGDGVVKIWHAPTGRELTQLRHEKSISRLAFSIDDKYLAVSSHTASKNSLVLWDFLNDTIKKSSDDFYYTVLDLAFSPDAKHIATAVYYTDTTVIPNNYDVTKINLYDLNTMKIVKQFEGQTAVCFTNNKNLLATYNHKEISTSKGETVINRILFYNIKTSRVVKKMNLLRYSDVYRMQTSKDDKQMFISESGGNIEIWNIKKGEVIHRFSSEYWLYPAAVNEPLSQLAYGTRNDGVYVFDMNTFDTIRTMKPKDDYTFSGYNWNEIKVAYSPDGQTMVSGSSDGILRIWSSSNGRLINDMAGANFGIHRIVISPDDKTLLSGDITGTVKIWDIAGCQVKTALFGNWLGSGSYRPDNQGFAMFSGEDFNTCFYELATGAISELTNHKYGMIDMTYNHDGTQFACLNRGDGYRHVSFWDKNKPEMQSDSVHMYLESMVYNKTNNTIITGGTNENLYIWNFDTGGITDTIYSTGWADDIAISPDGKNVVTTWNSYFSIFDIQKKKQIHQYDYPNNSACIAYSNDGNRIAIGDEFNNFAVDIFDLTTEKYLDRLTGHTSTVTNVLFTNDDKFVVSASKDKSIKFWDPAHGEEVLTFIPMVGNNTDFVVYTPDGYYMSSRNGTNAIHFIKDNEVYLFDQFDLKHNRPDIILERMGYASDELIKTYYKAYQKRLKKMNIREEMLSSEWHIPEIRIVKSEELKVKSEGYFDIEIEAWDTKYKLDRINVWVNNVPIYGMNGINLRVVETRRGASLRRNIKIPLSQGENKIEVSCMNEKGAESLKQTIYQNLEASERPSGVYIVTIGVSEYQQSQFNLTYAAKDATDLADYFTENDQKQFDSIYVISLLNEQATRRNIAAIKKSLLKTNVDDMVILFFAGHGLLDENLDYYLATHDIDFRNPSEQGLPYEEFENLLDSIPARKKLMLIDACHSGEVDKDEEMLLADAGTSEVRAENIVFRSSGDRSFKPVSGIGYMNTFELMKELFADLRRGTGATVISSAGGGEFAFEGDQWKNGVFTYSLIEGLTTGHADLNSDGEVLVSELRDYVFDKVSRLTNGRQNPTARRENLEFDFRVW